MISIVLAGGSGTRLWPMSRKNCPKQFMRINGSQSPLVKQTVERLKQACNPDKIVVVTNNVYADLFNSAVGELKHMIFEPVGKNTAPAIALGIKYCMDKLKSGRDELVFVSPSDHIIRPSGQFSELLKESCDMARKGHIITFGVKPTRPETGYGYIKTGTLKDGFGKVESFIEKPSAERASQFLKENYYWNSGMFLFTVGTMLDEFSRHVPAISEFFEKPYEHMVENFGQMPDVSIDYAVIEKSGSVLTKPLDLYWNDIGSWDSIYEILDKDEEGNAKVGDVVSVDTNGSLIIGNKRLIAAVGISDCIIVETDDAVMVCKRGETQKVKKIVENLRINERREAHEHLTIDRPWGSFSVLEEGPSYKIKRIVVKPNQELSLQLHYHRSEHWIVVSGTAKVTIGDKEFLVHENESAYVPKSTVHRLANPGKIPLEMIEVQNGAYLGEDDIVRLKDIYGRAGSAALKGQS